MVWKGDANNRLAKSLVTLFDQVEQSFPERKRKGNDGTIGDTRHQASGNASDHNPHIRFDGKGIVTALDITHDPANGFDAGAFAESLREFKDPRIQYVIFNGRIFSSIKAPWVWRSRDKGPGDHAEHVHVSVMPDPQLFDDTSPWQFDKAQAVQTDSDVPAPRTTIRLGDTGPAVADLQTLLGIAVTGKFDEATDEAVRAFQAARNLVVDGIVGSHTWGVLTEGSLNIGTGAGPVRLSADVIDDIVRLAGASALVRVDWTKRGIAPAGYIKGMAVAFGHVYAKLKNGDAAARIMAAAVGSDDDDALAHYDSIFTAARMDNAVSDVARLRHLFVLMIGLGMRESSGRYYVGRDASASNVEATSAEAGLFQMSWNMRGVSPEMAKLFAAYSAEGDGFLSIFKEGAGQPRPSDLQNFGAGEGVAYQTLAKSCPAFAVETAAIGLRLRRQHWGPINRFEAEVRPEAEALLLRVQETIDALGAAVLVQSRETIVTTQNKQLLALTLALLSKEKKMAVPTASQAQSIDPVKVLLPLLLQAAADGKPLDTAQIIAALSGTTPPLTTTPPARTEQDPFGKLIDVIFRIVAPPKDPTDGLPVNNALGTTIGSLLDGKKTAIGTIGALVTSLLSAATTAPPGAPGAITAVGKVLEPLIPAVGLSGFTMPIFLALAAWGALGKIEKWTQEVADKR